MPEEILYVSPIKSLESPTRLVKVAPPDPESHCKLYERISEPPFYGELNYTQSTINRVAILPTPLVGVLIE